MLTAADLADRGAMGESSDMGDMGGIGKTGDMGDTGDMNVRMTYLTGGTKMIGVT